MTYSGVVKEDKMRDKDFLLWEAGSILYLSQGFVYKTMCER